jgi:hypothetical protein
MLTEYHTNKKIKVVNSVPIDVFVL